MVWILGMIFSFVVSISGHFTDLEAAREAMSSGEWRQAIRHLTTHLQDDPESLEGYYLRGICYGEISKSPNLRSRLERVVEKGKEDLEFVLARDSLFRDVLYQRALIDRYDNRFEEAILLGEQQIRLKPELAAAHLGLLNFYWRYIVTTPATEARTWLRENPGRYSQLFIGRTLVQQGLYRPAKNIFLELKEQEGMVVPALLALTRLHFSSQHHITATRYMEEAITAIETELDALLHFDEIRTIVRPDEQSTFEELETASETQEFFTRFWEERDPMPVAPLNVRMAEHYRRLKIAELHYIFNGFRNWFRSQYTYDERFFPPTYLLGQDFDDQGMMFIRHGEPDDLTISDSPTWLYESSDIEEDSLLVFYFAPTCTNGVCGVTRHFSPYPRGETIAAPKLIGLDPLDAERKTQEYIFRGLTTDRHRWAKGTRRIDVPLLLASFRGLDNRTLVEAYFAVPLEDMITESDTVSVETGFLVNDVEGRQHVFNRYTLRLPLDRDEDHYRGRFQADLEPQQYEVAFHARSLDVTALSAQKLKYQPLSFSAPGLKISDVLLADSVTVLDQDIIEVREDAYVWVNPSGIFSLSAAPSVYFEVYDLQMDVQGRTRYKISYSLSDRRGLVTSLAPSEVQGSRSTTVEYIILDVAEVDPGAYDLTVTVEDLVSDTSVSRTRALVLRR